MLEVANISRWSKVVQSGPMPIMPVVAIISRWSVCGSHYFKVVSDPNDGCPHLVKAARQGTTALVDFVLETGADLEESDRLKCKPYYGKHATFFLTGLATPP